MVFEQRESLLYPLGYFKNWKLFITIAVRNVIKIRLNFGENEIEHMVCACF